MGTWEEIMSTAFFDLAPSAFYTTKQPLQTQFVAQQQIQRMATRVQSHLPIGVLLWQRDIYDALNASIQPDARSTWGCAKQGRGE